jgi:hypothetical protein
MFTMRIGIIVATLLLFGCGIRGERCGSVWREIQLRDNRFLWELEILGKTKIPSDRMREIDRCSGIYGGASNWFDSERRDSKGTRYLIFHDGPRLHWAIVVKLDREGRVAEVVKTSLNF